jgi:hypothetical protein
VNKVSSNRGISKYGVGAEGGYCSVNSANSQNEDHTAANYIALGSVIDTGLSSKMMIDN